MLWWSVCLCPWPVARALDAVGVSGIRGTLGCWSQVVVQEKRERITKERLVQGGILSSAGLNWVPVALYRGGGTAVLWHLLVFMPVCSRPFCQPAATVPSLWESLALEVVGRACLPVSDLEASFWNAGD